MDPLVRTIYFANKLKKLEEFVVVDIEKRPEIKKKFDPKGKGKYFLLSKDHKSIGDKNHEGSIQEFIDYCHWRPYLIDRR